MSRHRAVAPRTAFVAALLFTGAAFGAGGPPSAAKQEIDHLLAHLAASGCTFNRNGDWHSAADARAHLEKKYRYLVKKDLVQKAEDFITLAATESSTSHTPYQVRCADETEPSAQWLGTELRRFRESTAR